MGTEAAATVAMLNRLETIRNHDPAWADFHATRRMIMQQARGEERQELWRKELNMGRYWVMRLTL